jgi:acyl carrier protein
VIADEVRSFIVRELNWKGAPNELTNDYPLLDRQVLDSVGIFQLVSFVESEYGVEIGDEELVPENFGTIESIARLIGSKRGT